ncbi:MAG: hypothetical protein ABI861_07060 [Panacibacter sp.]
MKFILYILIACLAFCKASAQFIFIPEKPIKTLRQSIDKDEGISLTDSIPFSAIRIIDTRYDTTAIGFYIDGYLTLKEASQPAALQRIIDKYYHSLYTPGKDTLIISLNKLMTADDLNAENDIDYTLGYVSSKEFAGKNNVYVYYGTFDTMMKEMYSIKSSLDMHKHGKHMNIQFWDYYLLRLCDAMIGCHTASQDSTISALQQYFTLSEIKEQGLQKRNKPILTADSLKPGFYLNFTEFVNNNPSHTILDDKDLEELLSIMHYSVLPKAYYGRPDT